MNRYDDASGLLALGVGIWLVICAAIVVMVAIAIVPYWFITKRMGWSPWWCLIMLLPFGSLVWPYYVAFSPWPVQQPPGPGNYPPPPQA